ncbi:MAG: glycogen synthase [Armatimonadetes bacterium]|nr:glycogen synthase [Armatimonadota bacterium]
MKILFVSAEVSPLAKVGGLADVAGSLPKALAELGHDVRVIMPCYGMIEAQHALKLDPLNGTFTVGTGWHWERTVHLSELNLGTVPIWLVGGHERFASAASSQEVYQSGFEQYAFFSMAVLAACKRTGWMPDVVHCNDWHTSLVPVLMREGADASWDSVASIYTIHNLAYQGIYGHDVLDFVGLPQSLFTWDKLETFGAFNFLKAGVVYSDQVNTVSPTYAEEILTPEYGCGLWGLMRHLKERGRLSGILNGIDRHEFNPASDPALPANYSAANREGKAICRAELLREIGMEPIPGVPLAGIVSRLSNQKGMDLLLAALDEVVALPMQLFVQGVGDPWLADQFDQAARRYPNHVRFAERFDIVLGQRAYAGCDLFLMPSAFEPCGLGQMIAMRYGTLPVVRKTGGLADSVTDGVNGFVFEDSSPAALAQALARAGAAYRKKARWNEMQRAAFGADYGWGESARKYETLYERAVASRNVAVRALGRPGRTAPRSA